ncbi:hypothetical protein KEU06_20440 [Pseudaminobacter sp. 19-2017]|uniref:Antifreeze protein n=1 Tax=Pseudaminobacter soli (ex Zhang et al. 2022) TaxID=2831468 RepID=A0A942E0A6_9HYPH|nr:hypothetical protein [Pseudaminobacter soli]MBS3650986.1 hypothetical protein [Pseudaminobacter soli]
MFRTIKAAAASALVGLASLVGMAGGAQAEGLYLNFGTPGVGVHVGGPSYVQYRDDWRDYRRNGWRDYRRDEWRWDRRMCTPERAMRKAERLGLYRVRVLDVRRRSIDIGGRRHGDRIVMTFGRAPNCPVIG